MNSKHFLAGLCSNIQSLKEYNKNQGKTEIYEYDSKEEPVNIKESLRIYNMDYNIYSSMYDMLINKLIKLESEYIKGNNSIILRNNLSKLNKEINGYNNLAIKMNINRVLLLREDDNLNIPKLKLIKCTIHNFDQ